MNWAWSQELTPTPKLILMALADAANDHDECWPGIPFIARKCCVSERTVQRVLQDFQKSKLMAVHAQFDPKNGRRTSNRYRLNIGDLPYPDNLSPHVRKKRFDRDNLSGTGVTLPVTYVGDMTKSPLEPQHEAEQQPLHLPISLPKAEQRAIVSLTAGIPETDAQALIDELADALETATIRTNALRWFRGLVAKYGKGEFIAVGGLRIAARRARAKDLENNNLAAPAQQTDPITAKRTLANIRELMTHARSATGI
jgi:hypothetical protein